MSAKSTIKNRSAFPLILLFATATMLAGCGSTENYYLDPEYQDQKSTSPVLVIPVQKDWFTDLYQHPFGYLKGKDKQAFNSLIKPLISEHTGSMITVIASGEYMDEEKFKVTTLPIGNIQHDVIVPSEQAEFQTPDSNPRFVLLLDQFYFRKLNQSSSSSGYAGHGGGEGHQRLYFRTLYVYWDTVRKKPVAWGSSEDSISYSDKLSFPDYSELLSKVMKKIVDRGPVL